MFLHTLTYVLLKRSWNTCLRLRRDIRLYNSKMSTMQIVTITPSDVNPAINSALWFRFCLLVGSVKQNKQKTKKAIERFLFEIVIKKYMCFL